MPDGDLTEPAHSKIDVWSFYDRDTDRWLWSWSCSCGIAPNRFSRSLVDATVDVLVHARENNA